MSFSQVSFDHRPGFRVNLPRNMRLEHFFAELGVAVLTDAAQELRSKPSMPMPKLAITLMSSTTSRGDMWPRLSCSWKNATAE
jgi:hypothetical protein